MLYNQPQHYIISYYIILYNTTPVVPDNMNYIVLYYIILYYNTSPVPYIILYILYDVPAGT